VNSDTSCPGKCPRVTSTGTAEKVAQAAPCVRVRVAYKTSACQRHGSFAKPPGKLGTSSSEELSSL